jgi:hypothetical protein
MNSSFGIREVRADILLLTDVELSKSRNALLPRIAKASYRSPLELCLLLMHPNMAVHAQKPIA